MRTWILPLLVCLSLANLASAAPLVYTGHTISFSKAAFANPSSPENQDFILDNVLITRATTAGIYNAALEQFYTVNSSPMGTRWAFPFNNPEKTLAATYWADLTFEDWQSSLGGAGSLATSILDGDAVLHLVEQDIYLDIRFTAWGIGGGSGGSFTYERAEITPSADFDRDGTVDGRDFLIWQRGFGATGALQSDGDANFDGAVDGDDLQVWQNSYGSPLLAVGAVPEPSGLLLLAAFSAMGSVFAVRRRFSV
jgi:hypothetical protein